MRSEGGLISEDGGEGSMNLYSLVKENGFLKGCWLLALSERELVGKGTGVICLICQVELLVVGAIF